MPRVSIYVPDGLYELMQSFGNGINFSEIAQDAFRKSVADAIEKRKNSMDAYLLPVPTRGDYSLFEVPGPQNAHRVKVSSTTMAVTLQHPLAQIVAEFTRRQLAQDGELEDGYVLKRVMSSAEAQAIDALLTARARAQDFRCFVRVNGHSPATGKAAETYHVQLDCEAAGPGPSQVYRIDVVLPLTLAGRHHWQAMDREARRRCIESSTRAYIMKFGLPLAWGYENGKHVIKLADHPTNPAVGDPGEPFPVRE